MGYASFQFLGRAAVVKAYENMDECIPWSMLQGKQFLFKYEGDSKAEGATQLNSLLTAVMDSSGSEAVYTLRVYEMDTVRKTPKAKIKIYETTPFDGSFNFKLLDPGEEEGPRARGGYTKVRSLEEQIVGLQETVKTLAAKLQHQADQEDQDEEPEQKLGWIAGIAKSLLEDPQIKSVVMGKVANMISSIGGKAVLSAPPAKIAGPDPVPISPEQAEKANQALAVLAQHDPELGDNLLKLASIAEESPGKYQTLISMLKTFR
jgi:hypothetical protein